jgi:hypothetical protein
MDAFERELALEPRGPLYSRECSANTWYAIGALRVRKGDHAAARAAFEQATRRVARHPMARAGLALLSSDRRTGALPAAPIPVDAALAQAAVLVADGDAPGAARLVAAALASAPAGNAGWLVPVEPLLGVQRARLAWSEVLAVVRTRAS